MRRGSELGLAGEEKAPGTYHGVHTHGGRVWRGQIHTQLCGAQCQDQGWVSQTESHNFL